MAKELKYEDCFPGRFWTAGHLDGKKLMFTVANVYTEDLDGTEDKPSNKPPKLVMSFVGTRMELVLPKTNAYCLKEMFGNKLADWVNKRIVLYPTKTKFGGKMVDCIRIYGSPDIAANLDLTVPQGRNKPWNTTIHALKNNSRPENNSSPETNQQQNRVEVPEPDPSVLEAWSALGWSREQGQESMRDYQGADYLDHLSALVDQMNAQETTF